MPYAFNPFTGNLDLVNDAPGLVTSTTAGLLPAGFSYAGGVFNVPGDINLDDGVSNFVATFQRLALAANVTITWPAVTGVAAVFSGPTTDEALASIDGGYNGAIPFVWEGALNTEGSFGYNPTGGVLSVRDLQSVTLTSPTIAGNTTFTGRFINSVANAASAPAGLFSGAWYLGTGGGTSTTTKPAFYVEPAGATSTGWSTSGTGWGVNAPAGFAGRLADLQLNGTSRWHLTAAGLEVGTQSAPAEVNETATLTVANLKAKIITSTTAAAVDGTLPTGTAMDAGFTGVHVEMAFEWSVINTGPSAFTLLVGADHTITGSAVVATGTSGRFVSRRTAAATWISYRLS